MKVLVVSHTYIAQVNRDKWKVLAQNHSDVMLKVVFPLRWSGCLMTHDAGVLTSENLPNCEFIALDGFKFGNEMTYGYYPVKLFKLLKCFRPEVIHVEQGDNALSYFQLILTSKLLRLKPKFLFFTWINWKHNFSWKYRLFWKRIENFNLKNSSGAITGNLDAKNILCEKHFKRPVLVLPQLGVSESTFLPASSCEKQTKTICFIGRITPEKGVFLLLNAFAELIHEFKDWKLLFVGRGPCLQELKNIVTKLILNSSVEFCPVVPHAKISNVLQQSDILVLPSYDTPEWKEQFGHVLIEAMACRVAVIGSDAGEIPNVISGTGVVFEQNNKKSLKDKLRELMADEHLRNDVAQKGYESVLKNYTHDAIARKTYEFWKEFVS